MVDYFDLSASMVLETSNPLRGGDLMGKQKW